MFFEYQSGFEVEDILGQIKAEKKVARDMALQQRLVWLKRFESLICHFYDCNKAGTRVVTPSSDTMDENVIKMKMANEAKSILDFIGGSERTVVKENKQKRKKSKRTIYKYSCHVSIM